MVKFKAKSLIAVLGTLVLGALVVVPHTRIKLSSLAAKQPVRKIASTAVAFDQNTECIVGRYTPSTGFGDNRREARLIYRSAAGDEHGPVNNRDTVIPFRQPQRPVFVVVRAQCREMLERAADEALQRDREELRGDAAFPYTNNPPTPYCSVAPTGTESCTGFSLKNDGYIISRITDDLSRVPLSLQSAVSEMTSPEIQNEELRRILGLSGPLPETLTVEMQSRMLDFLSERVASTLTEGADQYIYYIVADSHSKSTPLALQLSSLIGGPRSQNYWEHHGEIQYVRLQRYDGASEWQEISRTHARRRVLARLRRTAARRRFMTMLGPDEFATRIIARVEAGADQLTTYWMNSLNALEETNRNIRINLSDFNGINILQDIGLSAPMDQEQKDTLLAIAEAAIAEASMGLEGSVEVEAVLVAAAYWWSARSIEIASGCANLDIGRVLVENQYIHQQCRRIFAERAYADLNRQISVGAELDLTSHKWLINNTLGSRAERGELYARALPILQRQIERSVFPDRQSLSLITYEVLQTVEELRLQQALTWNGLQPLRPAQLTAMNNFMDAARIFFRALPSAANQNRIRSPEFYESVQRAWRQVERHLQLGEYPQVHHSGQAQLHENEIQTLLARISSVDVSAAGAMQNTLTQIDTAIGGAPQDSHRLCLALVEMASRPGSVPQTVPGEYQSGCVRLVRHLLEVPIERRPTPGEDLVTQCLRDHKIYACHFVPHVVVNLESALPTPTQWVAQISEIPENNTALLRTVIRIHKAVMQQVQGPSLRRWRAATASIHTLLRRRYLAAYPLLPRENELDRCIAPAAWNNQRSLENLPDLSTIRNSIPQYCRRAAQFSKFWLETLSICKFQEQLAKNPQSIFVPIESYSFWLSELAAFWSALPRDRQTVSARQTNEISRALEDLLMLPRTDRERNFFTPRQSSISINCELKSENFSPSLMTVPASVHWQLLQIWRWSWFTRSAWQDLLRHNELKRPEDDVLDPFVF